jgi:hypothetical protein
METGGGRVCDEGGPVNVRDNADASGGIGTRVVGEGAT